ncbi:P protein [Nymphon striatum]|nr:P protein [Nymphon striatum]
MLVPRTLAAMIASTVSIAVLATLNEKPELDKILTWLDVETLVLLFSMMVIVSILCETGFFDYVAVLAYKIAKGSQWPLITTLCLFTAFISAFLDNVTTILLITPVTIRLCEVMGLDPRHVLVCMVIFSNIGGTATPIGDPPNVIIISNPTIVSSKIDFMVFTQHMAPGVIFCVITAYIFMRIYYSRGQMHFTDPPDVVEFRHEIDVWKKAYNSLPGYTHEEDVVRLILERKIKHMGKVLLKKMKNMKPNEGEYRASLKELEEKAGYHYLDAMILLVLADFEEIRKHISSCGMGYFSFFQRTICLDEGEILPVLVVEDLGLLEIIGAATEGFISSFSPEAQLNAAMLLLLWVSAIASTFMDNIPFTTAMLPVITRMADNLDLPLQPLVWSLAFGACLGGNGSLIGASANVVCAGIAENHGYRFTFVHFFKIGFPMMLVTVLTASVYLLICHSAIGWNY